MAVYLKLFLFLPGMMVFLFIDKGGEDPVENAIELHLEVTIRDNDDVFISQIQDAAMTPNGEILLLSYRERKVMVFDREGTYLHSFGREGRGPAEFSRPASLEVDHEGFVYIADSGNARISVWSPEFEHVTEFDFLYGWNTRFKRTKHGLFIWSAPHRPLPSGNHALVIQQVKREPWRAEIFHAFEYEDWRNKHDFLTTWSHWDMAADGQMITSGGIYESTLYKMNRDGELIHKFGKDLPPVVRTDQEIQRRLERLEQVSPEAAGLASMAPQEKHTYINLLLDDREYIWVHRSKMFGAQEEIDIYTMDGELKTMITFSPSEDFYYLLGIYGNRALFRVSGADGTLSLHVYRIEY